MRRSILSSDCCASILESTSANFSVSYFFGCGACHFVCVAHAKSTRRRYSLFTKCFDYRLCVRGPPCSSLFLVFLLADTVLVLHSIYSCPLSNAGEFPALSDLA